MTFDGIGDATQKSTVRINRQPGCINAIVERVRWYRLPGSNGGPLDPQSSALTN